MNEELFIRAASYALVKTLELLPLSPFQPTYLRLNEAIWCHLQRSSHPRFDATRVVVSRPLHMRWNQNIRNWYEIAGTAFRLCPMLNKELNGPFDFPFYSRQQSRYHPGIPVRLQAKQRWPRHLPMAGAHL